MIAVCTNPYRDKDLATTEQAVDILKKAGFETCLCPIFTDQDYTSEIRKAEGILVLGGDGTILAAVRALGGKQTPILGVNLGTKGFMTVFEPEDLPRLPEAFASDAPISARMMLDVTLIRDGEGMIRDTALNDVVLHGYGECIQPTAWADKRKMFAFSGDGLIISTPTGSTGYSMSAGGPIVEPDARAILLTPICAHTLSAKPFVLSPERKIRVLAEKLTGRRAYMAVDGYPVADLENGDVLELQCSEKQVRMVNLSHRSFFEQLEKLV